MTGELEYEKARYDPLEQLALLNRLIANSLPNREQDYAFDYIMDAVGEHKNGKAILYIVMKLLFKSELRCVMAVFSFLSRIY